ncbi:hypothetical protein HMPREF9400_0006 [Campylobacter upsaliensis JV21]|uniref:Uncharacterized protein n=1 Tax=Campylobacter upsaliensis JV21 TaxID=888826 RepID=A0A828QZV9_CAMUP|nr:hypothetical protein HMPREF9400_0006 [Campylobacter upsaliensis JV21]
MQINLHRKHTIKNYISTKESSRMEILSFDQCGFLLYKIVCFRKAKKDK